MNKQEMIEMQSALTTIPTTGIHTITMANCLQFLEQRIREAALQEAEEKAEKVKNEQASPGDKTKVADTSSLSAK